MLVFTFLLAIVYFIFSMFSSGFYQHDEVSHLLSMNEFWREPSSILGNWSKPGYKVFYIFPVLLGKNAVILMNCLVSAFTAYLVYRVLKLLNSNFAVLGFILIATQPYWVQLAFRNYSELISGFLIILAVFLHYRNRFLWAALVVSYMCIIRQELYLLMGFYGLYLLFKKQWIPAFSMALFPLLINLWGGIVNGDPLYLVTSILESSSVYGDAYPRQGFDHYFKMAIVVFGATGLVLFFAYLGSRLLNKKHPHYFVVVPTVVFFLTHCVFMIQKWEIGPATGGNLRYLMVISPLIAVLGALAMDELSQMKKRYRILIFLIPVIIVIGLFMTYDHNNVKYSTARNYLPLVFSIITALAVLIPVEKIKRTGVTVAISGAALLVLFTSVKPFELSPEDETMQDVSKWYKRMMRGNTSGVSISEDSPMLAQHPLLFYYIGKNRFEFEPPVKSVLRENIDSAAIGTVIVWDSHYSYRPKLRKTSVQTNYFNNRPTEFKKIRDFKASKGKFNVSVFQKIGEPDEIFNGAFKLFQEKKWQDAANEFQRALANNPNNQATHYYLGACYHNLRNYQNSIANYNRAIQLDPNYDLAYLGRSNLFMAANQLDQALKDVDKVIERDPKNIQAYNQRGTVYFNKKDWTNALNDFIIVAKLNPKFSVAYFRIGQCQINLGQTANACNNLKRAKELGYKQADGLLKQHCGG